MSFLIPCYAFAIGAIVGSFLNVVIYRYPRGESVVFPSSHCPRCGVPIHWYDNVPILSWFVLAGRCRGCHEPFSPRYPLVEAANALFYLAIVLRAGVSVAAVLIAALVPMTIALIYIDADIQILPDVIDLPGVAIGIALSIFGGAAGFVVAHGVLESVIGAAAGAGFIYIVAFLYERLRGVEGMGFGDAKMLAMIGSVVGWRALFPVVLLASVCGAIIGILMLVVERRPNLQFALPFGTFLGLSFLTILFFGETLAGWLPSLHLDAS